jgi:hypothetical protein
LLLPFEELILGRWRTGVRRSRGAFGGAAALHDLSADFFLDAALALDGISLLILITTTRSRRRLILIFPGHHISEEIDGRENKRDDDF